MNQYYYVPLMNGDVKCDGVSLREHLEVVAPEIYSRECQYLEMKDLFSESNNSSVKNQLQQMNQEIDEFYQERRIPRRMIITFSSIEGPKELGSGRSISSISMSKLQSYSMSGDEVVDVYVNNYDYSTWCANFFEMYDQKKESYHNKRGNFFSQKVLQKIPFISGKTHN